jgi:hypothetical protein
LEVFDGQRRLLHCLLATRAAPDRKLFGFIK